MSVNLTKAKLVAERWNLQPLQYSLQDVMCVVNMNRTHVGTAIRLGHLKSYLIGNRRKTTPADVAKWVAWLQKQSELGKTINYTALSRECEDERRAAIAATRAAA